MKAINKEKLCDYLERSIEHQENPESFQFQMEMEISKYLKAHEQNLKISHHKIRLNKIIEEDLAKRRALQNDLGKKLQKSVNEKAQRLQHYSKSLADLRRKKENVQVERVKAMRNQQIQASLKKIKQWQHQREAQSQSRFSKSASQNVLKNYSRSHLKQKLEQDHYQTILEEIRERGIFNRPGRVTNLLHSLRAKQILSKVQEEQIDRENKIEKNLGNIEKARKRKQALLAERSKRIKQIEKYQFQLNRSKFKEIKAEEMEKRNQLIRSQEKKLKREIPNKYSQMDINRSHSKMIQRDLGIKSEKEEKKISYRDLIRQQIDKFLKQNSH